jgi:dTDP-4-amino-4,6-dideoxygalactose transaminase
MSATQTDRLAVNGGTPVRSRPWPAWPIWDETEEAALRETLHSGQWWALGGRKVPEFEEAFARFQEARFGTCVPNGTAALEVVLRAMGVGPGDEVIVPPYTFVATASAVLSVGATPAFVDVEPHSLNMDPRRIQEAVTPRTRAIIAVHIAGRPADMDCILAVASRHGLPVIEDAAQAHAAEWQGRKVGALGVCGTFSFQASKNLNAGEGGIVITNDEALADKVWSVHNVGRVKEGRWYEHNVLGGNFRMTEWQAAILLAQLQRLPEQTARRSRSAAALSGLLSRVPGITPLPDDPRVTVHAYHLFIFRYDPAAFGGRPREEFLEALTAEGVPCYAGYVPLYKEKVFQDRPAPVGEYAAYADRCPVCEEVCRDVVWLPQHLLLASDGEMADVAEAVARIQNKWAKA